MALVIYIPIFPAVASLLYRYPRISYLGVILFCILFYLLNYESCDGAAVAGGASMVQVPTIFFGAIASAVGVGISWAVLNFVQKR